jgi:6-phosphogluconate dehydrogenase (decarboxylating)
LAVGVGQQLPRCQTEARIGITAQRFNTLHGSNIVSSNVLISLGSNGSSANLARELVQLRTQIQSERVVWLLSANNRTAAAIAREVANSFNDQIIDAIDYVGRDGVHPSTRGYASIANQFLAK